MKKILGLDLGASSIGWAMIHEAESDQEQSSIQKMGVRVNPLTVDEMQNFEKGKSITTNASRTLKRSMRRNLQRYKLRRDALIKVLKSKGFISESTLLAEAGNRSTFDTYKLRSKAVTMEISLEELARVLLLINKKRGYKSSRKVQNNDEGTLIDGIDIAKQLLKENITPGQLCVRILQSRKKKLPSFYRSDLQAELDRVWNTQKIFYPSILTDAVKEEIKGKNRTQTWKILEKYFIWQESGLAWDVQEARNKVVTKDCKLMGIKRDTKGWEQKLENYQWREEALTEKIDMEKLAIVLQEINGQVSEASGYLGAISDRSKLLMFENLTVGQFLMKSLETDSNSSLRNMVFYRQDYIDEFNKIWDKQATFHSELTPELKKLIRDEIIFFQRNLKSKKGLISYCEFEQKQIEIVKNNKTETKTIGCRVIPRSHPLFQEFKIWQSINDIEVFVGSKTRKSKKSTSPQSLFDQEEDALLVNGRRFLTIEEKELLAEELSIKEHLSKTEVLKLLFENVNELDMNFKQIDGNKTGYALYSAYSTMMENYGYEPLDFKQSASSICKQVYNIFNDLGWNTEILRIDTSLPHKELEQQPYFRLWHLLYSFEGDNSVTGNESLIQKLMELCHIEKAYASILVNTMFTDDYASLSAKAIRKILPYLKEGNQYDTACLYAGYKHSAASLTKEEIQNKVLKDKLDLLPRNSLRNPVVEKILNQMVNVVNSLIDVYGKPDEIRVELARELKKSAKEREELTKSISQNTKEHENIRSILKNKFGMLHVSRADIIRYKLYCELERNGFKTLYSNRYIPEEKLFSKDIDIEHILPQSRLFDDSLSNKTIEYKDINIEKGNKTAYDFVKEKYGEEGILQYQNRCEALYKDKKTKLRKLMMEAKDIPDNFIDRDLRNTQYISKKALQMLGDVCRRVVATTGAITDKLRQDWQLVDLMKELNLPKYEAIGSVSTFNDRDGRVIKQINDWTKRNDHRHHAMDALTVAFTKDAYIQYFNHKNASFLPESKDYASIVGIKNKYFENGRAIAPMPLQQFRQEAKRHLKDILISIKAKNKVVTRNENHIKTKTGEIVHIQQTPRGQLHNETIYGSHQEYVTKVEKVNASFDAVKIGTVSKPSYRIALLKRLAEYGNDPKKAFTGKNTLEKNPLYTTERKAELVPEKVTLVTLETIYTIRKAIDPSLNVSKVIDSKIRSILEARLAANDNDPKKAFINLDDNPIWINREKGIQIKRVTIRGISNALPLRSAKDVTGKELLNDNGKPIASDFVNTGNNHHVAFYARPDFDKKGNPKLNEDGSIHYEIEEVVVSFFEAVTRANLQQPIIDKEYKHSEGWKFLFSMKQNEYFVFPNPQTGFNPHEIDLLDPANAAIISPNLYRVQKFSSKDYTFRHHLETTVDNVKALQNIAWKRITSLTNITDMVKVRINHIGQIVSVGEY